MHVSAKDLGHQQAAVDDHHGASRRSGKDDIDRMVRDVQADTQDDRRRREEVEIRHNVDTLVNQTNKLLREQGENVEPIRVIPS